MKKRLLLVIYLVISFASAFSQGPSITTINPASGTFGTTVTITGTDLSNATAVSFGATPASSFTVVSATTITAVVGTGSSGAVSVTTPDGSATIEGFTFQVPTVTLTKVSDGAEAGNEVQFRVRFPAGYEHGESTTVNFNIGGTADAGDDFESLTGSVVIPAEENSVLITVQIINDQVIETDETVTLQLTSAQSGGSTIPVGPDVPVEATISDNDNTVQNRTIELILIDDGAEPGTNAQFRVSFPGGLVSSAGTTVTYQVGGTATEGIDYAELSGSVVISAGANSANIDIEVNDDTSFEGAETVVITLLNAANADLALAVADEPETASIADNEEDPANNVLTLTKVSDGAEGGADVQFRISFPENVTKDALTAIQYEIGGSAVSGQDFSALPGTLTIPANTNAVTLDIDVLNDQVIEGSETLTLRLVSAQSGVTVMNVQPATAVSATLSDNDNTAANNVITLSKVNDAAEPNSDGLFRVSFPGGITSAVATSVSYSVAGTATNGTDYQSLGGSITIPAGQGSADVVINVTDDEVFEGNETVSITLTEASNSISDLTVSSGTVVATLAENEEDPANNMVTLTLVSDGEEGGNAAQFRVSFPSGITKNFQTTVNYQVSGSAGTSDYTGLGGSVVIPAGQSFVNITVPVVNDLIIESTETLGLTLTSATAPAGVSTQLTTSTGTVTADLVDNDNNTANNRITLTAVSNGAEPSTNGQFRVSFPAGVTSSVATTVSYTIAGTASDADHNISASVQIPANTNSALINVTIVDDQIIEGNETVSLTLTGATNSLSSLTITPSSAISITISDNDNGAPSNVLTLTSVRNGGETGLAPQFLISFPPNVTSSANSTVNYTIGGTAVNGTDYTTLSGTLQIPANSNSAVINLVVNDDQIIEGSETVILTLTSATSGASALTVSPATGVSATINDNDNTATNNVITLTKESDGAEPGEDARFTVSFPEAVTSAAATTVTYTVSGTGSNGTDYENLNGTVTIPAGSNSADILVAVIDDQQIEITETVALTLRSATNAISTLSVRPATSVIANLADNDSSTPNTITLIKVQDGAEPASNPKFRVSFPVGITSSAVTVVNYSVGGTATAGTDYAALPGSIIIPAGSNSADIDVIINNDQVIDPAETVALTLTTISNSLSSLSAFPATAVVTTIADDDIPVITSFSPANAVAGETLTVTGNKFDPDPEKNIVYFGPVRGEVVAATPTSLSVKVPPGAAYQPISVTIQGLMAESSNPFLVSFPNNAEVNTKAFSDKVDFPVGDMPNAVAMGDLNGDNKTDIIVANYSGQVISILQNASGNGMLGTGAFLGKVDFPTSGKPVDVAVQDLDGDGKLDVAMTNELNVLSVYRNNSSGDTITFDQQINYSTSNYAQTLDIADIDQDGKPDLVVSGNNQNVVSVFRNISDSGRLAFASKVDFQTGTGPQSVAVADLNGDRKPDLGVTNYFSNTVSVFRNTTVGNAITFAEKSDFATGTNPFSLTIADWDLDGKPDLGVANLNSGTVSILRNTGSNGSIAFAAKIDLVTGTNPYSVSAGSLDGDGKPDLAVAVSNPNSVTVFKNTSTVSAITFNPAVNFSAGNSPSDIAIGDLNGDGKPDLAATNFGDKTVSVFRNAIDQPVVSSISPMIACVGTVVTISGSNLTGVTSVAFGEVQASSFTAISSTTMTAVVPAGAAGEVIVATPKGMASISGFSAVPIPGITTSGSTTFASGGQVVLTASTGAGYSYMWQKDGQDISGATQLSYTANQSGSYRVRILEGNCGSVSEPVIVKVVFALPVSNYAVSVTSESCRTSNNGRVAILAKEPLNYTATIISSQLNLSARFTDKAEFNDLAAGQYNVCITVDGQPEYKQCYDLVITEPEDLAVYTAVNPTGSSLELTLKGSETYLVELNGETHSVKGNTATFPLKPGTNRLRVSTGKECQGIIERVINFGTTALVYPNPFENILNLNLGTSTARKAQVEIRNTSGTMVYSGTHANESGAIQLNLPEMRAGIYVLKLSVDGAESIYKIIRK